MAVEQIRRLYETMPARASQRWGRGLTLAEKILVTHAGSPLNALK